MIFRENLCIIDVKGRITDAAEYASGTLQRSKKKGFDNMLDKTMTFSVHEDRENEMKEILTTVYDALKQKGYNPINQLVGYILS